MIQDRSIVNITDNSGAKIGRIFKSAWKFKKEMGEYRRSCRLVCSES